MKRTICLILAAVLCIGLLAGCGDKGNASKKKLMGTWVGDSDYSWEIERQLTFKNSGKAILKIVGYGNDERTEITWSVDSDNDLHLGGVAMHMNSSVFEYSEDAMDGDNTCWYIDGDTLYLDGMKWTKQS